MKIKLNWALICVACLFFAQTTHASVITWSSIQDDTGNASDVNTLGVLHDAKTISSTNTSLNGVTFLASGSGIIFDSPNTDYFDDVIPSSWDSSYRELVGLTAGAGIGGYSGPSGFDIIINNLLIGDEYLVQLWNPYWNRNWLTGYTAGNFSGYLNTGTTFIGGTGPVAVAQYVTGTFIADDTTQTIRASGLGATLTPSLQVRNITTVQVPEPGTISLLGLALAGLGFARKRKTG